MPLKEYQGDPRRLAIEGAGLVPGSPSGPLQSPIYDPSNAKLNKKCDPCLAGMDAVLGPDGKMIAGKVFPGIPTTACQGFIITASSGVQSIPAAGSAGAPGTAICASLTISEGYRAILQGIGFEVIPMGNFADITYQLSISGEAVPKFTRNPFIRQTAGNPIPFYLEVPAQKTLVLKAFNTGSGALYVTGIIYGFMRPNGM